ncbi:MAG: acyltransferase [Anaerolineae bacterium]|nr:acyltransferase [Anaerolineae bacterium]
MKNLINWLANKLSRVTSTGDFVAEIDGLRFLAIGMVFIYHLVGSYLSATGKMGTTQVPGWTEAGENSFLVKLVSQGKWGVELFFVISGFILAIPFASFYSGLENKKPSLKRYYLRRLKRIEPPYIISMLLIFLVRFVLRGRDWVNQLVYLGASLIYGHNIIFGEMSRINIVAWSLEIEVQFYVLVPLLAMIFIIKNGYLRKIVLALIIILAGVFPLTELLPGIASWLNLLGQFQFFLSGFLLADIYLDYLKHSQKTFIWDLLSLAGLSLMLAIMFYAPVPELWLALPILIFYIGVFKGKISNFFFTRQWIVIIGGMCYSIYLYHNGVVEMLVPRFESLLERLHLPVAIEFAIQFLIVSCVTLVICSIMFLLFEKPFMNKPARKVKSPSEPSGETAKPSFVG